MSGAVLDSLKALGRHIGWIRLINGSLKANRVKREYGKTVAYYGSSMPVSNLRERLTKKSVFTSSALSSGKHPRIFFLGTDEQQDRSGILQALGKFGDVSYFTRADGSYGQIDPAPPALRKQLNTARLWELIQQLHQQGQTPDILIAQTWASVIEPSLFTRIRNAFGTMVINISMDDRQAFRGNKVNGEWEGTLPLIPHIDLTLTAAPECVEWYQKEGCPALFFPEASDPDIFHPMPEFPKLHEVCFVGLRYGIRERIVASLRKSGFRVTAYGAGWEGGRLDIKDVPRLFAQSKIVLGVGTIGHCDDFYALKMRDFDGPMSGSCYVTHDNPDLRLVYKVGKEIVTYRTVNECIEKVRWYLSHEDERERVAQAGRARALADHTWEKRFRGVFEYLKNPALQ
jgi:hypothetical protein